MNHSDHVALLRPGVERGGVWADFGSGRGAFTLALADLLGPDAEIHSVDRDASALRDQTAEMRARFPAASVHYHTGDFTGPLRLPPLNGIVMANALHFVRDQAPVVRALCDQLVPGGRLILVEYESTHGNPWVPHPISYQRWRELAPICGLVSVERIAHHSGRFMDGIYSALARRPPSDVSRDTGTDGC